MSKRVDKGHTNRWTDRQGVDRYVNRLTNGQTDKTVSQTDRQMINVTNRQKEECQLNI